MADPFLERNFQQKTSPRVNTRLKDASEPLIGFHVQVLVRAWTTKNTSLYEIYQRKRMYNSTDILVQKVAGWFPFVLIDQGFDRRDDTSCLLFLGFTILIGIQAIS